jgi:hypothetical protein
MGILRVDFPSCRKMNTKGKVAYPQLYCTPYAVGIGTGMRGKAFPFPHSRVQRAEGWKPGDMDGFANKRRFIFLFFIH